jgi:hypothetical protein
MVVLWEAECFVGKKVTTIPDLGKQVFWLVKGQQRAFIYGGRLFCGEESVEVNLHPITSHEGIKGKQM